MTVFKKTLSALGVCAALLVSAQAIAANEATLKVTGTIVPAACTPALSNGGEVAFGSIAASTINNAPAGNGLVQLGSKDITFTISCEAAASVGFKMIDNRSSSAVALSASNYIVSPFSGGTAANQSYVGFGLGLAPNNAKIGAYSVSIDGGNVTADGLSTATVISDDEGRTWRTAGNALQVADNARIVTVANTGSSTPKLFTDASFPMKISAGVQTASILGSDEIEFDGNATLSLVYL